MRHFNYWDMQSTRINESAKKNIKEFMDYITSEFFYSIDGIAYKNQHAIPIAIDWLKENYKDVPLSQISNLIHKDVVVDGLSLNHIFVSIMKHKINEYYDFVNNNSTILEIGAGYGALAREILLDTKAKYIIIDLPCSLKCSYAYLNYEFPNKKHAKIEDINFDPKDFDILYIDAEFFNDNDKTMQVEKILNDQNIELAINTCSFCEMYEEDTIFYYNLLDKYVKYVYWMNRFTHYLDKESDQHPHCYKNIPKHWKVAYMDERPKWYDCPGNILNVHAEMAEMFLETTK